MQNLVFLFFVANFHFQLNMLCWCEWGISENEQDVASNLKPRLNFLAN